jgi:biopolymer transport protein ExbB
MTDPSALQSGLGHFWAQGDGVSHALAYVLLLMSLLSWYLIFSKAWSAWRISRSAGAIDAFWAAPGVRDGLAQMALLDRERVYLPLAEIVAIDRADSMQLGAQSQAGAQAMRLLRSAILGVTQRIESGLTVLASIASTAPFVGLLGTVWGIHHALAAVSDVGMVQIDKVAGPVGEALIMTAFGLAVAIPAVLAYNGFNRVNRLALARLDGFAHDLHAHLTLRLDRSSDQSAHSAQVAQVDQWVQPVEKT